MLSVLTLGAWAQTSPYTGVAVSDIVSGNDYFLYNVETGKWIQGNNAKITSSRDGWNTAANMGDYGRPFKLEKSGDNWILNPQAGPNKMGDGTGDAGLLYLDGSIGTTTWTITGSQSGYTIKSTDNKTLGVNSDGRLTTGDASNTTWQIVSRDERISKLSNASPSSPQNVSWMLVNPELMNNDKMTPQWTVSRDGGNEGWQDGFRPNRIFESWSFNSLNFYQTITVPNGIYEITAKAVYSPTGGSSCSKSDYDSYAENGDATVYAAVYVNGETGKLASIYSFTSETPVADYAAKELVEGGISIVDGWWQAARAMGEDDKFISASAQTDVTSGSLTVGIKSLEGNPSSNWVIIGSFELKYLGPVVDLTECLAGLNATIADAEAFNGQTTTALANALSSALTAAIAARSSEDANTISNASTELRNALTAAQEADVSVLRPSVEYAKAKGVNVSAQEDYLVNGTSTDVASQLNAVIISVKQHYAETSPQPTVFTMISESVVGTDDNNRGTVVTDHADGFYVYNVGTGRWFCGGDDWGAHAAVGFPGIKITTPEDNYGSGKYNKVKTWLFNGNWNDGGLLGNNGYCDTGGNAWKFWKQDATQGIYTWSNNGNDSGNNDYNGQGTKELVGFTPSTYMRVDVHQAGADNPYNQWIFVTEAQRDEMAADAWANASESNPVDLTYKIKMPGFNQRERKEGTNQSSEELDWICNRANYCYNASDNNSRKIIMGRNDNHADFVCDVYGYTWNEFGNGDDSFSWTQTVTGLTPGKYRVKVQGYNNGGDTANKACLVANGQKVALVERSSESVLPWTSSLPNNTFDNPEYFQVGCYWNAVTCVVGSDGELTLGVKSPNVTGAHVVIFDNFRLEYIGLAGVEVGPYNYTTFVAPYDIAAMPDGVEAYACQVNASAVHLEPVTAIPAGEAVVLKNTGSYKFSPATSAVELGTTNDLLPSDGSVTGAAGNIYALASKTNGVGFYPVGSSVTVPAGKGYLVITSEVKPFYGFEDDDATAIADLNANANVNLNESIYNLAGQRMSKAQKGINIVNGKKVLR